MAREERFIEIQNEISDLLDEALSLLNDKEKENAKNHWYARIKSAMFDETEFASQAKHTMDDSIDSFKFTQVEIKFNDCDDSGKFILAYRELNKNEYDNFNDEKVWFECEDLYKARDLVAELKINLLHKLNLEYEITITDMVH